MRLELQTVLFHSISDPSEIWTRGRYDREDRVPDFGLGAATHPELPVITPKTQGTSIHSNTGDKRDRTSIVDSKESCVDFTSRVQIHWKKDERVKSSVLPMVLQHKFSLKKGKGEERVRGKRYIST